MFGWKKEKKEGPIQIGRSDFESFLKAIKWRRIEPMGAEDGIAFDDMDSVSSGDNPAVGIMIRSGYIVDGIGLIRKNGQIEPYHGSAVGGTESVIRFQKDDGIVAIEGYCEVPFEGKGGAISGLKFITKNGSIYGEYGTGKSNKSFRLDIMGGCEFRGFCGRVGTEGSGEYISALGMIYEMMEECNE